MSYQSMREQLVLPTHSNRPETPSAVLKRDWQDNPHLPRFDFNSSNQVSTFPIKHSDPSLSFDTEKHTPTEALSLEAYI